MKPQPKLNAVRPFYVFIDAQIYFQQWFSSCGADGSVNHLYTNCGAAAKIYPMPVISPRVVYTL